MKVYTTAAGKVVAEAESVQDVRALLGLSVKKDPAIPAKAKVKTSCPECGKRVKQLRAHIAYNHSGRVPIVRVP